MRQLDANHKTLWDQLKPPSDELTTTPDCDAALLAGWTDRDISLWDVSGVDGNPGLIDILVALCRNKKKDWDKISYLRFPKETVPSSGLELTRNNGNTGDQRVDNSHVHYEIKEITGKQLCSLLFHISCSKFETGIFSKREFDSIVYQGYEKFKTSPVAQSATSQAQSISLQAGTSILPTEQLPSETPIIEQIQREGSSTTDSRK